ncbi:SusC/RagA family TonB-linked outer membrane protein [Sphingobacterium multivorum]|uniref:SusC/RagA family TonB-linked outer membrane protein n=1 Tax=Sphingobacterium multivorum TaxID=28454 RepID=UPI00345EB1E4
MKHKLLSFFVGSMILSSVAFAQEKKVSGRVTGADGKPLVGVTIAVQGSNIATQTDANGKYSLSVPVGKVMVFRYVGHSDKTIIVKEGQSLFNVSLEDQNTALDEVVVVAYGTAKKESVTGSVTSVSAKDIEKRPVTNAFAALEGSAAGIQLNNTSGMPGAEPSIRIRGFSSLNGSNNPLYVVDGVPFGGNISDINPNDVESISVLKDASSSALYGSRASNGVIIITTKKGKAGRSQVNISTDQGFYSRGIAEYDRVNDRQFMEAMWLGYRNSLLTNNSASYPTVASANDEATKSLVSNYLKLNIYDKADDKLFDSNGKLVSDAQIKNGYADDLDWFKEVDRVGHRQNYNIDGTTATDKAKVFYSTGYLDEKGYIKNSGLKRFTGRLNAELQAKDWFKYGFNLAGSHQISNQISGSTDDAGSFVNPYNYARSIAPIYPIHLHNADGSYALDEAGKIQYDNGESTRLQYVGRHTIWENELNRDQTVRNTVNGRGFLEFKFLKDFTLTLNGDLNLRNSERRTYNNAIIGDGAGQGRAARNIYRYKNYTVQQLLTWNKDFGLHHLDLLAGHENYSDNWSYLYGYKTDEIFEGQTDMVNFTKITSLYDYQEDYRVESFLSRARYNYAGKYFAEASFRRDGSSRFSPDNRWGNFWSLGGSWSVSKEDFFKDMLNTVNELKVRASYGEVGNDESANKYSYLSLYELSQNANAGAVFKSQNPSPDLIWETSSSFSAAIEARLFKRANLSFEYFNKQSQNLIFDVNLPLSAGATSSSSAVSTVTKNIGSMSNRGFELTFDVDVLKGDGWRWNVGANATWLTNKILSLPEENRENGIVTGNFKWVEGGGRYDFWLFKYAGVDQLTGRSLYLADTQRFNVNGSAPGKAEIPTAELVEINGKYYVTNASSYGLRGWSGSVIPKMNGSFNTSFEYKNFSFSALFTYAIGGKVYDSSYAGLMAMSGTPSALHSDIMKSWNGIPDGMTASSANRLDVNGIPAINFSQSSMNNYATSDRFLVDGSYLVIKNIAVGYSLPKKLVSKIDLSSVRVVAGIENLSTMTKRKGMNPQQQWNGTSTNAWVTPRTISFGVKIGL